MPLGLLTFNQPSFIADSLRRGNFKSARDESPAHMHDQLSRALSRLILQTKMQPWHVILPAGIALRIPTPNVSVVDLVLQVRVQTLHRLAAAAKLLLAYATACATTL